MLGQGTELCLACSSSLPPRPTQRSASQFSTSASRKHDDENAVFFTKCCNRPVCPTCLSRNPRLARYNPCLHCLGGVDIVNKNHTHTATRSLRKDFNIDGGVKDGDVFTLGDADEDDPEIEPSNDIPFEAPPPAYTANEVGPGSQGPQVRTLESTSSGDLHNASSPPRSSSTPTPSQYYIQPGDTLLGIALRFRIDERVLCRLNGLPQSTLRTTPHLLHTRTVLTLPPSGGPIPPSRAENKGSEYEAHRARERAGKRLQTVTKEVDWRVAQAYVAVADVVFDADALEKENEDKKSKSKNPNDGQAGPSLEANAINRYLDDEEWERRERQAGRGVSIPRFPLFDVDASIMGKKPVVHKLWSGWK